MTDLVSLLFIAMIPIDFKIFPYTCLFTFFVTIVIFDELASITSATSNERMTTDIIFAGTTPIN